MKTNDCEKYRNAFEACVMGLQFAAQKIDPYFPGGMDYKKINVLIFCVAGPLVFAGSVALNVVLAEKLLAGRK